MSTKIIKPKLSEKLNPDMEVYYYTPWAKQEKDETPLFWLVVTFE